MLQRAPVLAHDVLGWEPPGGTGQTLHPREASKKCETVLPLEIPRSSFSFGISQGSDLKSTTRLVKAIIELEYDARDYVQLNSSINTLSKKHGQLKGAIQVMVELAMSWLDEIKQRDGIETWLELVETLRTVTEGKARHSQLCFLAGLSILMRSFSYS